VNRLIRAENVNAVMLTTILGRTVHLVGEFLNSLPHHLRTLHPLILCVFFHLNCFGIWVVSLRPVVFGVVDIAEFSLNKTVTENVVVTDYTVNRNIAFIFADHRPAQNVFQCLNLDYPKGFRFPASKNQMHVIVSKCSGNAIFSGKPVLVIKATHRGGSFSHIGDGQSVVVDRTLDFLFFICGHPHFSYPSSPFPVTALLKVWLKVGGDPSAISVDHSIHLLADSSERASGGPNAPSADDYENPRWKVCAREQTAEIAIRFAGGILCFLLGCGFIYTQSDDAGRLRRIIGPALLGASLAAALLPAYITKQCYEDGDYRPPFRDPRFHGGNTVIHKYLLTSLNYCITVLSIEDTQMANVLATEKKVAIVSALAEGSGIRQIERMTGVHRDTIMRLGVKVGQGCAELLDTKMRDLSCGHLQFDELWGFIGKKKRNVTADDSPEMGDVWTWVAIDAETKLVPTFAVGKRDAETAGRFVSDVASRLANRVQVSTDGLVQYGWAMEMAFKGQVDFAQVVKVYDEQVEDAEVIRVDKISRVGNPNMDAATTSHVERLNGTTRLHMRRLTRRTYAFSKKLENFEAAVGLHFAYYNLVKRHNTLRCTPAMAAGVEQSQWTVAELVEAVA
jgi:IS1 family transposase